jgi:hypothetical protein
MINNFSGWLFNLMLWGAVFALVGLLYATFAAPAFLHNPINALIALGVVAMLSLLWPKF